MGKRVSDLSIGELAAMGAKAARAAARSARDAGLAVTGTVTTYEHGEATTSLAVLHPSGTVTRVRKAGAREMRQPAAARGRTKAAD